MNREEYLLNKQRQNILVWYPFAKSDEVLLIGEETRVINEMLKEKVSKVSSFKRGDVIEGMYDKVVLIDGLNAKFNLLDIAKSHLKDGGHLLVIGANKLGARYFTGAKDDSMDHSFANLDSLFSRREYDKALKDAGVKSCQYYYPYPDHTFTQEIFTDESVYKIPTTSLCNPIHYDGQPPLNVVVYDEKRIFDEMLLNGIGQNFFNSFFIDCVFEGETKKVVDYAKVWTNRKDEFAIYTTIDYELDKVYKYPYTPKAIEHLKKMDGRKWPIGKLESLPYKWEGDRLSCDILKCQDMTSILNGLYSEGRIDEFWAILNELKSMLYAGEVEGGYGPAFKELFGEEECSRNFRWLSKANIDLNTGNIFVDGDRWIVIDQEWFFEEPIPAEFVLWITVTNSPLMGDELENQMLKYLEVDEETIEVFKRWWTHRLYSALGLMNITYRQNEIVDLDEALGLKSKYESLMIDYQSVINSTIWRKTQFLRDMKDKRK